MVAPVGDLQRSAVIGLNTVGIGFEPVKSSPVHHVTSTDFADLA